MDQNLAMDQNPAMDPTHEFMLFLAFGDEKIVCSIAPSRRSRVDATAITAENNGFSSNFPEGYQAPENSRGQGDQEPVVFSTSTNTP